MKQRAFDAGIFLLRAGVLALHAEVERMLGALIQSLKAKINAKP